MEIAKDRFLLDTHVVEQVEWHFYYSNVSNTFGASGPLIKELEDAGITIVFH